MKLAKVALVGLLASVSFAVPVLAHSTAHVSTRHADLAPNICDRCDFATLDGASATYVNHAHHLSVSAVKESSVPVFASHDCVYVGARINASGLPANSWSARLTGTIGSNFRVITTYRLPGSSSVDASSNFSQRTVGGVTFISFDKSLDSLPRGTTFETIYIMDNDAPISFVLSGASVNGIATTSRVHQGTAADCGFTEFLPLGNCSCAQIPQGD